MMPTRTIRNSLTRSQAAEKLRKYDREPPAYAEHFPDSYRMMREVLQRYAGELYVGTE